MDSGRGNDSDTEVAEAILEKDQKKKDRKKRKKDEKELVA